MLGRQRRDGGEMTAETQVDSKRVLESFETSGRRAARKCLSEKDLWGGQILAFRGTATTMQRAVEPGFDLAAERQ